MPAVLRVWRSWREWAIACGLALIVLMLPRIARAEAPSARATPVHVLGLDSDDAENQADAMTGALRSRVRSAPGWSLQETQHALGMLTAALRCPQKPDAPCLQRIGDQLHTDRYVWGVMSKAPGNQVVAEVHLWARGKGDAVTRETYSDNLKDQNDETLRRIAARIFERITGSSSTGTVTVHAGDVEGAVWINGQRRQALEHGAATIELAPGGYAVEVRAGGFAPASQSVTVNAGQDSPVSLKLVPQLADTGASSGGGHPTNVRRIVAWSAIGVGAALAIAGGAEGLHFLGLKSDLDDDRNKIDKSIPDVCAAGAATNPAAVDACSKYGDAKSARTLGLVLASAGVVAIATGIVLLATDHPKESSTQGSDGPTTASSLRVLPYASPRGAAGVDLALTF